MPRILSDFCKETKDWRDSYSGSRSELPVMDIDDRLRSLEKRLSYLEPTDEQLAKYPSLLEAYENFRIIRRLTIGHEET